MAEPDPRDVADVIRQQHDTIRDLMRSIEASPPGGREDAFRALVRLLAVHETAEEMTIHPAVRHVQGVGDAVADAVIAEEDAAKRALAALEAMDRDTDRFAESFRRFRADVEEHAAREESDELPLLERSTAEARRTMTTAFLLAEDMAPTHAHRSAPESVTGNLLVGPFVTMVDRVRDAIHGLTRRG